MNRVPVALPLLLALATGAHAAEPATPTDTLRRVVVLPVAEVSTTRFDSRSPAATATLDRGAIRRGNFGQPLLCLAQGDRGEENGQETPGAQQKAQAVN